MFPLSIPRLPRPKKDLKKGRNTLPGFPLGFNRGGPGEPGGLEDQEDQEDLGGSR